MATSKRRKPPRTRTTRRRGTTSTRLVKPRRKRTAAGGQRVANFSLFNINFGGTGGGRGRRKRRFQGFLKGLFKTGREVGKGVGRHMPQAGCLNSPGSVQRAAARTGGQRQPSRVTGAGAGAAATLSARGGSRSPRSRFAASVVPAGRAGPGRYGCPECAGALGGHAVGCSLDDGELSLSSDGGEDPQ
jgi:hypothetical protein